MTRAGNRSDPPDEESSQMTPDETTRPDRRAFLQAGALATASALGTAPGATAQGPATKPMELPRRPLGKTGIDITILDQGTGKGPDVDRLLRYGFARGVRAYDTSETYHSEGAFKKWFAQDSTVRKQIFLVTKDSPKVPAQLMGMLDKRLAALGTDYVDLLFIHSFGDYHTLDEAIAMVKSKELKDAIEKAKKSGKARLVGISTHHKDRPALIQAAAEGGIVDVIMLQYRPWLDKDSPLNKAIDAAWKKGIGLISMKQIAGNFLGDKPQGNILEEVKRRVPVLAERKLTPYQGLLTAIWSDERMSAVCTTMRNTDHIRDNTDAASRFEPLKEADIRQLRDARPRIDVLRRLRRPMLGGRGHAGRPRHARAVLDLSRASRGPHPGPPAVRRAAARGPRLVGRRSRSGPRRLPQSAQLCAVIATDRAAPRLKASESSGGPRPPVSAFRWGIP
jgi:uncharacterized protein